MFIYTIDAPLDIYYHVNLYGSPTDLSRSSKVTLLTLRLSQCNHNDFLFPSIPHLIFTVMLTFSDLQRSQRSWLLTLRRSHCNQTDFLFPSIPHSIYTTMLTFSDLQRSQRSWYWPWDWATVIVLTSSFHRYPTRYILACWPLVTSRGHRGHDIDLKTKPL